MKAGNGREKLPVGL